MAQRGEVTIIGAGLAGCVLGLYLARQGYTVRMYERRENPRQVPIPVRRSTSMVISARGWRALGEVGAEPAVRALCMPLAGRLIHVNGEVGFQPYGRQGDAIFAVSRQSLHTLLLEHVEREPRISVFFGQRCVGVEAATGTLELVGSGERTRLQAERIIAADGAFSAVRQSLVEAGLLESLRREVPYGYTEMPIPAAPGGGWVMANHGMHLWPRGSFLLTAFPTVDGQFASTLVLPQQGEPSVASLRSPEHLLRLFEQEFPDVLPFFPHLAEAYFARPSSTLVTITCDRWTFGGHIALLGDAAHAMVPFLGQGMNAALEDCTVLVRCLEEQAHHWPSAIARYEVLRKPDADAVTQLSLQHFTELAENSLTPEFRRKKQLEQRLYQLFPDSFVPLYQRLAFSLLPYHEAALRGARQEELLQRLLRLGDVERRWEEPAFLEELRVEVGKLAGPSASA